VSFYEILDPVIALLRRQRRVYAADYRNRSLTDERAQKLLDAWSPSTTTPPSAGLYMFRRS
jgi:hypothetical protein